MPPVQTRSRSSSRAAAPVPTDGGGRATPLGAQTEPSEAATEALLDWALVSWARPHVVEEVWNFDGEADLSPAVAGYLEKHAVDVDLAYRLGVRSRGEKIIYPVEPPRGDAYERIRDLDDEKKRTLQPAGKELVLWWPAGQPGSRHRGPGH